MSKLFALFRAMFQGQLSFWTNMFEERVALRLAWIAFAVTLITSLYAMVNAIIAGISFAMPNWLGIPATWVVPSNFDECVTAYMSARVAVYVFEWKMFISSKYMG